MKGKYSNRYGANPATYERLYMTGLARRVTLDHALDMLNNARGEYSLEARHEAVLQIGFEVASNLLNDHWVPKKDSRVSERLAAILARHFEKSYVIGIHVRAVTIYQAFNVTPVDQSPLLSALLDCARSAERTDTAGKTIKYFLVGDWQGELAAALDTKFPGKLVLINDTLAELNGAERAIIDNELLSECAEIVVARDQSTYAFVGILKSTFMPLYVDAAAPLKNDKKPSEKEPNEIVNNDDDDGEEDVRRMVRRLVVLFDKTNRLNIFNDL